MTALEIKLMSVVAHLVEHIATQEPMDRVSAEGLLDDPEVFEAFATASASSCKRTTCR
jgi:hypothetical protein